MSEDGEFEDVRDIASKAVTQTAKLALILHLATKPQLLLRPTSEISLDTWVKAQALGTYHLQEAVRVQRTVDTNQTIVRARRVLAWINQEKLAQVTPRQLMQYGPRPRPNAAQARNYLDLLVEHGYLLQTTKGKNRHTYIPNPTKV